MNNFLRSFWPAILWSAIIFVLLVIPGNDLPEEQGFFTIPYFDKLVHFLIFGIWVAITCHGINRAKYNLNHKITFLSIAILGVVFGYGMELFQKFFTIDRSFDITDIWADALGSFAGLSFSLLSFTKK